MAGALHGVRLRRPRRVHNCQFLVQEGQIGEGRIQVGEFSENEIDNAVSCNFGYLTYFIYSAKPPTHILYSEVHISLWF